MAERIPVELVDWQGNRPASRAAALPAPGGTPRRIRLSTLRHVADEMARVYREARSERLDPADLGRFVFALSQLGKVLEVAELERRLVDLEKKL